MKVYDRQIIEKSVDVDWQETNFYIKVGWGVGRVSGDGKLAATLGKNDGPVTLSTQ